MTTADRMIRDCTVMAILESGWIEQRLNSRWRFLSRFRDDLKQDIYLRLLNLYITRPELVIRCRTEQGVLTAVIDRVVKECSPMYRELAEREPNAKDAVECKPEDIIEEIERLVVYLPKWEQNLYGQYKDCRYNVSELAKLHNVSATWMSKEIGRINNKMKEIWEQYC